MFTHTELLEPGYGYLNSLRFTKKSRDTFIQSRSRESSHTEIASDKIELNKDANLLPFQASSTAELFDPYLLDCDQVTSENGITDVDTIGVLSNSGSVIHYSLNSSMGHGQVEANNQTSETFQSTVIEENGELTLRLLNVYLSLLVTDAKYAQSTDGPKSSDKFTHPTSPRELLNKIPASIGPLTDVIVLVDQITNTLSSFLHNSVFQQRSNDETWELEDLTEFQTQITAILNTLVLKYAPQAKQSEICDQFSKALALLRKGKADTNCWKQARISRQAEKDDWISEKLEKLVFVPRTLVDALSFDIIMPHDATPLARSRKAEIETLEIFTTLYAIMLLETRKLFEVVVMAAQVTKILPDFKMSLLLSCLEGFLRNSVISGNTELIVGLDKLVQTWVRSNESFNTQTAQWGATFLFNWETTARLDSEAGTLFGSIKSHSKNSAENPASHEFDLVHLFVNEVLDICVFGSTKASRLETLTVKKNVPSSGLGWLTIFQDDHPDASVSILQTRTIDTTTNNGFPRYANEFSLIEDETTMNAGGNDRFWKKYRHHHHKHQFREWMRNGFYSSDVKAKHKLLEKCHRAKNKLKELRQKLTKRGSDKASKRPKRGESPILRSEWHRSTGTVLVNPKVATQGNADQKIILRDHSRDSYSIARFNEVFERTTYDDQYEQPPHRYENLRRKKDRFMFLFFGEEK